eukprot:scaffold15853_cov47-Prasinocladus_malaysianus.AAC.2
MSAQPRMPPCGVSAIADLDGISAGAKLLGGCVCVAGCRSWPSIRGQTSPPRPTSRPGGSSRSLHRWQRPSSLCTSAPPCASRNR